jgi:hypothetical protein
MAIRQLPLIEVSRTQSPSQYSLQVGAWGDDASIGSMGVRAEIRTRIYSIHKPSSVQAFWVGDDLNDGGFVQFGYVLLPAGGYCANGVVAAGRSSCIGGSVQIGANDSVWFWQYYPNRTRTNDYYSRLGPSGSAGSNGTWHCYSMVPNLKDGWDFLIDGQLVSTITFHSWALSRDPAYVVAEEVTSLPAASGTLGPVEFRNLAYLKQNGWHQVTSLSDLKGCGVSTPSCNITIPYGVSVIGPDHVALGTGM